MVFSALINPHYILELVLMIPQATSEGTQRENLKHSTTFDDALAVIHETIGCTDVPKKPVLSYKLSTGLAKAPAINLGTTSDWVGCLEEVTEAESKKNTKVSVVIIVLDIVRRIDLLNSFFTSILRPQYST